MQTRLAAYCRLCSSFMSSLGFQWLIQLNFVEFHIFWVFAFSHVEEMVRGLTIVPWERVDVSFQKSKQRYVAHSTIQVKFISCSFPAKFAWCYSFWWLKYQLLSSFCLLFKTPSLDQTGIHYTKENAQYKILSDDYLLILS